MGNKKRPKRISHFDDPRLERQFDEILDTLHNHELELEGAGLSEEEKEKLLDEVARIPSPGELPVSPEEPPPPAGITVSPRFEAMVLNWDDSWDAIELPEEYNLHLSHYKVAWSEADIDNGEWSEWFEESAGKSSYFIHENLDADKKYRYRIKAINVAGESGDWSEIVVAGSPTRISLAEDLTGKIARDYLEDGIIDESKLDDTLELVVGGPDGNIAGMIVDGHEISSAVKEITEETGHIESSTIQQNANEINFRVMAQDEHGNKVENAGIYVGQIDGDGYVNVVGEQITLDGNVTVTESFQVGGTHIEDDAITTGHISSNTITSRHITSNSISTNEISSIDGSAVDIENINADNITTGTLDAWGVEVDGSIVTSGLDAGNITTGTLDANNINVINLDASNITTGHLSGNRISSNSITSQQIDSNTITATEIRSNAIRATHIRSNAISADHIDVGRIDAITGDFQHLTAVDGGIELTEDPTHGSYMRFNFPGWGNNKSARIGNRRDLPDQEADDSGTCLIYDDSGQAKSAIGVSTPYEHHGGGHLRLSHANDNSEGLANDDGINLRAGSDSDDCGRLVMYSISRGDSERGVYLGNMGSNNILRLYEPGDGGVEVSITTGWSRSSVRADYGSFDDISASAKSFFIKHPDPEMEEYYLKHSTVETPTAGDNVYRYKEKIEDEKVIELPNYFKHLNKNPQVFVVPADNFGTGYGKIEGNKVNVKVNEPGNYNILVFGTRKDEKAEEVWKGDVLHYSSTDLIEEAYTRNLEFNDRENTKEDIIYG